MSGRHAIASATLSPGQPFVTVSGRRGTVGALLGSGGQGEVYHVMVDGLPFALKWYHRHYVEIDRELRKRLDRAINRGAPTSDFLWPFDLVEVPGSGSFGYFMALRSDRFVGMQALIAAPPRRLELPLARRIEVCLQLANSFLELHASGFCYQDINFGNIFLDPADGRILICDNDNVNVDGAEASIYGTRKFMAPEVVRREALPDSRTDLFSMAVLFFYTLFGWHPLDGKREYAVQLMDADAEMRLYGTEARFLFDPADDSNGPVPGYHDPIAARWNSLPTRLRALFERAFGAGLHDPSARVLETEWRVALRAAAEAVYACEGCGFEHVAELRGASVLVAPVCVSCGGKMEAPRFLILDRKLVALTPGRRIAEAGVERHPERHDIMGLRNTGDAPWRATLPEGSAQLVAPGQTLRIVTGTRIEFAQCTGVVAEAEARR